VIEHVATEQVARRRAGALRSAWPKVVVAGVYVPMLVAAEALAAFGGAVPAAVLHGVILVTLLTQYVISAAAGRVIAALTLVPLLRLSSLALSIEDPLGFYVVSGVPVLLAAVLAADALDLPGILRLWDIRHRSQWHVALVALFVAEVATPLLSLEPVAHARSLPAVLLAALIVFLFAGVLEELVFRGVLQGALTPLFGGWSVVLADVLFAATYLGSGSAAYAVCMAAFGLACGFWVRWTGSLAGAAIGHGLFAAGLLVIWPVVL
jgi:uncharacterized protein